MKLLTTGIFLLLASCLNPAPEIRSSEELIHDNSNCVYKIEVNLFYGATVFGSCTAYKSEVVDLGYKIYFITAKHVVSEVNESNAGYICFNKLGRYLDYSNSDNITRINFITETLSPDADIAIISIISATNIRVVEISTDPVIEYQEIYTLGFGFGEGLQFSDGRTSYFQNVGGMWVSNAEVVYGCSGGGVFDKKTGKLIGTICQIGVIRTDVAPGINVPQFIWHIHKFVPITALKEKL